MAEVLLFHHALGRTAGVLAFADRLERAGHRVHVPDLYDGRTFDDVAAGVAHAQHLGIEALVERGEQAAGRLPDGLVLLGISLGVLPAQALAQRRAGAAGAVLVSACVPVGELGGSWPAGVRVQVHAMEADPVFVGDGDLDAARQLVSMTDQGRLFLYPGDAHLFLDGSLPSYDEPATRLLTERVLALLATVD